MRHCVSAGMKLNRSFYRNEDVVALSRQLLGKLLCTFIDGIYTSGYIIETEAYAGETDKASHAYGGRRTKRTETMYAEGGTAYVYLCYGIHSLFNVVTNKQDVPHAILIRAIFPKDGIEHMQQRRRSGLKGAALTKGPGTVSTALGIHFSMSGKNLGGNEIWVEDEGIEIPENLVHSGPRIGVDYAEEDAKLPYRFFIKAEDFAKLKQAGPGNKSNAE